MNDSLPDFQPPPDFQSSDSIHSGLIEGLDSLDDSSEDPDLLEERLALDGSKSSPSLPPKEPRKSVYDAVVLHKLIVNVSWAKACEACNMSPDLRGSAAQRYTSQKAWFDWFVSNHKAQASARLVVSTGNVLAKCSIVLNDYLAYLGTRKFPAEPDIEFIKRDKEIFSTLERAMAVATAIRSEDSPFVKDAGGKEIEEGLY